MPKPRHYLNAAGRTAAATIGNTIAKADVVLEKERPEAVLVVGEPTVAGGDPGQAPAHSDFSHGSRNRCFDMRVPEEINRRIVDHVSDINLCYTEHGRRYLLAEGLPPDRVDENRVAHERRLDYHRAAIETSDVHARLGVDARALFRGQHPSGGECG